MPCNDVTELIKVAVSQDDRLTYYRISKRACGRTVGTVSLLLDHLKGQKIEQILALDNNTLLALYPAEEKADSFVRLKHLLSLKAALAAFVGEDEGGPNSVCAIAEINFNGQHHIIDAEIKVKLMTDKIVACGIHHDEHDEPEETADRPWEQP